ncbi:MAG: hypothetical protein RIR43_1230, partial [Pseudomonadota bacterium]
MPTFLGEDSLRLEYYEYVPK